MARILIVDDDPDIIEGIKVVLESRSHQVLSALSGEDGLKKAKKQMPELVILDIMMETRDKGFDVARALKKDNKLKNVPILMLTAIKDKMGLDFKKESGDETWLPVDDYVDKPLKPDELISKVENLLKK
jgi:CheY-like chemotaxis protein